MTRRGRTMWPTLALVSFCSIIGYGYYMHYEITQRLRMSETRVEKLEKRHSSMKSQLQVVYEHRAKLEGTLTKERQDHVSAKQDLLSKLKDYDYNLTRTRHEAFNRFNALDTQHKMLKAQHEELSADYNRMQQQYVRLGDDHRVVVSNLKGDYQNLKEAKDKESKALQDRVQELYNENEFLRSDLKYYQNSFEDEKKASKTCSEERKKALADKKELSRAFKALNEKAVALRRALKAREATRLRVTEAPPHHVVRKIKKSKNERVIKRTVVPSTAPSTTPVPSTTHPPTHVEVTEPTDKARKKHRPRPADQQAADLRMRDLMIRNEAIAKEDSIKDQYDRERAKDEQGAVNNLSQSEDKLQQKETDFRQLVDKEEMFGGNYPQEQRSGKERGAVDPTDVTDQEKGDSTGKATPAVERKPTQQTKDNSQDLGVRSGKLIKFEPQDGVKSDTTTAKAEVKKTEEGSDRAEQTKEEAGKEFMRKQLRLQERKGRPDSSKHDEAGEHKVEIAGQVSRETVTTEKTKEPGKGDSKPIHLKNSLLRAVKGNGERRQLQPPNAKLVEGSDIAEKKTQKSTESEDKESLHETSEHENQFVARNNPVASPLKSKGAQVQKDTVTTPDILENADVSKKLQTHDIARKNNTMIDVNNPKLQLKENIARIPIETDGKADKSKDEVKSEDEKATLKPPKTEEVKTPTEVAANTHDHLIKKAADKEEKQSDAEDATKQSKDGEPEHEEETEENNNIEQGDKNHVKKFEEAMSQSDIDGAGNDDVDENDDTRLHEEEGDQNPEEEDRNEDHTKENKKAEETKDEKKELAPIAPIENQKLSETLEDDEHGDQGNEDDPGQEEDRETQGNNVEKENGDQEENEDNEQENEKFHEENGDQDGDDGADGAVGRRKQGTEDEDRGEKSDNEDNNK